MTGTIVTNWARVPTGQIRPLYSQEFESGPFTGTITFRITVNGRELNNTWNFYMTYLNDSGVSVTTGGETTGHGNISILFTNRNRVTPIICLLYRNIDISVGKFVYPKPRFESGDGGWYELTKDIGEIGSLGDINYMFMCYGEPTDFTGYTIRAGPFTPLSDGPIVNVSALSLDGSLNILNFEVDSYLTVTNPAISGVTYLNAGTLLSLKPSWADIVPSIYYGNYSYAVGDYPVSLSYTGNIWTENTWRIRLYHGNITHPTSLIYLKQTTCTYVPYTLQSGDY